MIMDSELLLPSALEATGFGTWVLDVTAGRATWSARMADLHGLDQGAPSTGPEEAVFAAVVDEDRIDVRNALERARRADDTTEIEYRVDVGGSVRWIALRVAPIVGEGGLRAIAGVATDATERKRDEINASRRRAILESLRWVQEAMIAGRALDDTAAGVIESACDVLGAEVGVVVHPEPGDVGDALTWQVCGFGDDDLPVPSDPALPPGPLTEATVSVVADLDDAAAFVSLLEAHGLPRDPFNSALVCPVRGPDGVVIGHLLFGSSRASYFNADDASLAASIASTTGVAIDNARRHEAQRLAARTFQRELLPDDSQDDRDDVELCVRYHPGRSGVDIGGDWYDVIDLPGGQLGLAVGDVCGHGFTAAAHMSQLRHSFRALVLAGIDPVEAFRVLNHQATHDLRTTVTIAYVQLDPSTGAGTAWSCGHLPPVLAGPGRGAQAITELHSQGPMLGFLHDVHVPERTFQLDVGSTLLLYTDGLVERRGEDIDEGLRRLATSMGDGSGRVGDLCDRLYGELAITGPDADDTALLAIRRRSNS